MIESDHRVVDPQPLPRHPRGARASAIAGVRALMTMPVDAIPDLSENQVIVFTDWMGRSPQEIEDQVTYPLSVEAPGAGRREGGAVVERVQLLDDHHHLRRRDRLLLRPPARARAARRSPRRSCPQGVTPYLAPDATALGPDLLVHRRGRRRATSASCGRSRTGTSATSSTASRAWPRSPASAVPARVPDRRRPEQAPGLRHHARRGLRGRRRGRTRPSAAASSRRATPSTSSAPSAGSRTSTTSRTPSSPARTARRSTSKTVGHRAARPGVPPQRAREGRQRGGRRRGADAPRREPARGHRSGSRRRSRARSRACPRACGSCPSTTARR